MLSRESPRSQHNEVFLQKEKGLMVAYNCALFPYQTVVFIMDTFTSKQKSCLIFSALCVLWLFVSW